MRFEGGGLGEVALAVADRQVGLLTRGVTPLRRSV